jgi:hypothetical protein
LKDYLDFDPEEDLPAAGLALADDLLPDVADWLLPLPVLLLPDCRRFCRLGLVCSSLSPG